ncbi:MAG TPA: hypothetical protein ENK78_06420 [Thiothrix sp.]|nr:hypothetical protein [Thiothrix sp.]
MSPSMTNTDVSSLLVPIDAGHLLFPENMVAELIALQNVVYHAHGLAWINLHGVAVPLLSLHQLCPDLYMEQLAETDAQAELTPVVDSSVHHTAPFMRSTTTSTTEKATMVLLLHTLLAPETLPLLALQVTGSPHPVNVNHKTLQAVTQPLGQACVYIASHVRVANLPCVILDLPAIEQSLLKMMPFSNSQ